MGDNITLIGMPGCGKSTVGVLLAKLLGRQFLDVDLLIQQRAGLLLQEILDQRGTEYFLEFEEEVVCSLDCRGYVIAPGGSAVCRPRAAEHLKKLGTLVYLRVGPEELERRIRNLTTRGIAAAPGQTIRDILNQRAPLYERYADLVVDCPPGQDLAETAQEVLRRLREGSLL